MVVKNPYDLRSQIRFWILPKNTSLVPVLKVSVLERGDCILTSDKRTVATIVQFDVFQKRIDMDNCTNKEILHRDSLFRS